MDLIDRPELARRLATQAPEKYSGLVAHIISTAPAVEAQKHGRWIEEGLVDGNQNRYCRCSECGKGDTQAISQRVPYCWWCGAKMMDEVKE